MAHTFSPEDKEVREFKNRFDFGIHKVQIEGLMADRHDGKDYLDIGVVDPENAELTDNVRFWFNGGAANVSFNELRNIYVHNAPEDKKDAARASFDAIKDTDELTMLMDKVIGGEAWMTIYYDKTRTYRDSQGRVRRSINRNLHGYEPKLKPELMPAADPAQAPLSADQFPADDVPFVEPKTSGIPEKTGW